MNLAGPENIEVVAVLMVTAAETTKINTKSEEDWSAHTDQLDLWSAILRQLVGTEGADKTEQN